MFRKSYKIKNGRQDLSILAALVSLISSFEIFNETLARHQVKAENDLIFVFAICFFAIEKNAEYDVREVR